MFTGTFFGVIALLYYLCFLLLTGLVVFLVSTSRPRPRLALRRVFCWLALSLLVWQVTLFLEPRTLLPSLQLWLGRLNFTAIVFAVFLSLRFVQAVAARHSSYASSFSVWLLAETCLLAVVTLFTPLIDAAERVEAEQAIATYGFLFPLYLLHVVGYLAAALVVAFRESRRAEKRSVRRQLTFIAFGLLAMGGIALLTNAVLPYFYGNFRFCDLGTLSVLFFVVAIAYAMFVHRLFDLRLVLRETLVYGILMAFVLGGYSATVFVVTQFLTDSAGKLTQFAVLFFAFSFDPLRRFLEEKTDRLLFGERRQGEEGKKAGRKKRKGQECVVVGTPLSLATLARTVAGLPFQFCPLAAVYPAALASFSVMYFPRLVLP